MSTFVQDVRHAVRALARAPGFTTVAVATLALGIGANAAMFGVVDALLFRPPAEVGDAGRMVRVQMQMPAPPGERGGGGTLESVVSWPDYVALRDHARGFDGIAAWAGANVSLGRGEERSNVPALLVSGNYFQVLRTRAALGRVLLPEDDADGAPAAVAVLSWDYWQRAHGGDASVIGQTVRLNDVAYTIVGVAPRTFTGTEPGSPALFLPLGNAAALGYDATMMRSRFAQWLSVVARLAEDVTREQAQEAARTAVNVAREEGSADAAPLGPTHGQGAGVPGGRVAIGIRGGPGGPGAPGGGVMVPPPAEVRLARLAGRGEAAIGGALAGGRSIPVSLWFMAITGAVLLIACANVANLLLARGALRTHEIAVRLSLGASRSRVARLLMTESFVLSVLGGLAGILVAVLAIDALPRMIPLPPLPRFLDGRVLVFTALLTIATMIAFGLAPALLTARMELQRFLTSGGRLHTGRITGRSALVVVQLAASLVLLVGAGLFIRSLRNVSAIDTGFDAESVMIASVDARESRLSREQMLEMWELALERVRALPGVASAALGMTTPFEMMVRMPMEAPGYPSADGLPRVSQVDFAGERYFETLGIEILEGRGFTADDHRASTPVVVVSRSLAREIWGGESPIGRCLRPGMGGGGACLEVVGVAEDARFGELTGEPSPMVYRALAQRPPQGPQVTVMHVRTSGDQSPVIGMVRDAVRTVAPDAPFVAVRPIADLLGPQIMPWRIGTLLFGLFGGLGVALAMVGLYGVLSFLVTSRTRELGVRIALGAQRRDVLALVLGQGGRLIALGLLVGGLGAVLASRVLASMLYGIGRLDPVVYAGTAALLAAVGIMAVLVPARRATTVDPTVALRAEG